MKNKKLIIIGLGSHSHLLIEILKEGNQDIIGATELKDNKLTKLADSIELIGEDKQILNYQTDEVLLVNGIGMVPGEFKRKEIFNYFSSKEYTFTNVIHPSTTISKEVKLGEGVQVMASATILEGSKIGNNSIINTNVSVDHNCFIGSNCHIAPGVTMCGNVMVGNNSFIGAGVTIINNIKIGKDCIIGAGSTIYEDLPDKTKFRFKFNKEILSVSNHLK